MNLGKYIEILEKQDPEKMVTKGLGNPHSWRGVYCEVAFEVVENVTVEYMLTEANKALTDTFEAWKGGEYNYDESTPVNIETGEGSYSDGDCTMMLLFELMFKE